MADWTELQFMIFWCISWKYRSMHIRRRDCKTTLQAIRKTKQDQFSFSHKSNAHVAPPHPPPSLVLSSCSSAQTLKVTLKCSDNWRASQVADIAEEALSVLSQPTSCCDNISELGGRQCTPWHWEGEGTGGEAAHLNCSEWSNYTST